MDMETEIMALMMEPIIEITEYFPYSSKFYVFIMTKIIKYFYYNLLNIIL